MTTPGADALGPVIARLDQRGDEIAERLRGRRIPDAVAVTASRLGDFSLVWHLLGLVAVARQGRGGRRRLVVMSVLIGAESLIVNQGIKRLFRRARPTVDGDERTRVRRPRTSSFPSGHASAAAFAVGVAGVWQHGWRRLGWAIVAAIVSWSRVHVRIHHVSDVAGGLVTGALLAVPGRRIAARLARSGQSLR